MRSRGLVVAIAVVLAVVAAAGVVLYTNGVKEEAVTGGSLSVVMVAKQDIAANTNLNPLIDQGAFGELQVPSDAVVDGAVTDISQLSGQTTTSPILANEQIVSGRLSSGELPDGGALGISDGHVAVSIRLGTDSRLRWGAYRCALRAGPRLTRRLRPFAARDTSCEFSDSSCVCFAGVLPQARLLPWG